MLKKTVGIFVVAVMLLGLSARVCDAAWEKTWVEKNYKIKRLVNELYNKPKAMDAQRQLENYGSEVTPFLMPLLEDKTNDSVRIAALNIIAAVDGKTAEDAAIKLLKDRSARVRKTAARTLSVIGSKPEAIKPLKKLLSDYSPEVRFNAIRALAAIAPKEEVNLFIGALGDYDPRIRMFSVKALGKLKSKESVQYLVQMVRDPDPDVRMALVTSFAQINTAECVPAMVWLMTDPEVKVKVLAVKELTKMTAPGVEEALVGGTKNMDPRVASLAIVGLMKTKSSKAVEIAISHLDDEHMLVKVASIEVIGKMGDSEQQKLISPLMEAESSKVRKKARAALEKTTD
ncbi:MAG: HEAT repeat domain-containing protein [Candidatus Tantalella remota]|nr:HEAT repeat domain-containing protein [Candidatus Tantalella remota]